MSEEMTVFQKNNFELTEFSPDMKDMIAEELDGLGNIPFDTVKIPSGGALAFEVPGDGEEPDMVKEIVGVVVDNHSVNALWMNDFTGERQSPDCSSFDGRVGTSLTGDVRYCDDCPFNQFGSGKDGIGKKCKNMRRVYILRSGDLLPILLQLPPSSLTAWKDYVAKRLVIKGKRPWQVLTKVTLKKEKSAGGIAYSQAVFTKVADLGKAEIEALKPVVDSIKALTRSETMQTVIEESDAPSAPSGTDEVPFGDGDNILPF